MSVFAKISTFAFLAVFIVLGLHCFASMLRKKPLKPSSIVTHFFHILTLPLIEQNRTWIGAIRKLVYLLAVLAVLMLAITGFFPSIFYGKAMTGFYMMIHTTFGGIFAVCAAFLAVACSPRNQFIASDWPWLAKLFKMENQPAEENHCRCGISVKIAFWLLLILSLSVILSIVLSMFHLFGTEMQHILFTVHKFSALTLAIVAIIHLYILAHKELNE